MRRLFGLAALVAVLTCSATPVLAQTAPFPAPSTLPPVQSVNGHESRTARADTNPADGTVGYQVDGSGVSGGGSASHGSSRCVGETPEQAGVSYGGLVKVQKVTDTVAYPQPMFNGANLPLSGSVPNATDAHEYVVVCSGVPVGYGFWTPAPAGPGTSAQVQTVAQSVAGTIQMPSVTIESSPSAGGIDGLNTWFWTSGYMGGPIVDTRTALGVTIEVDATPTSFVWSFGDGTPVITTTSLGVPWQPADAPSVPGRPDCDLSGNSMPGVRVPNGSITHCYRTTSTSPLTVSVTFNFAVSWRANGGPFQALPPIQRTATRSYPVQQIVSSVVARS
jgi:hypothetical protein